ncbi:hypothetical protein DSM100688_1878 [Bifidobacterium ramosum]|uniref:Uncharacterized protein n=1 Tax=Bifidobacterium ramosum TaxID=1798158 RepID=A0A6L4WYG3_9BIFI|nr:hypothetical protein [Bifidobacterium ramosum]KAB8287103.1 hypothetical protein DSM100688_1878 [Bifidobacterium ramosum]NEG71834.1 hypothetical protein [Bifidobacterium ramosum]
MNNTSSLTELLQSYDDEDLELVPPSGDDLDSPKRIERQLAEGVKRGQVWLASDYGCGIGSTADAVAADSDDADDLDDNSLYVLVAGVNTDDPRLVTVIPLSNDLRAETDDSLVIEQGSPLGEPMVAWPTIPAIIPVRLLYKPLKQFAPATVDAIVANDPAKADPADVVRQGETNEENDSPFVQNREDTIAILLKWHVMCAQLPKLHDGRKVTQHSKEELEAYADALETVLHLVPGQRLAVIRGKELTPEQQQQMTEAGFPESPYSKPVADDDYLIEVEQPLWRVAADAYASSGLPGDPRERLAYKAQFELAARVNGHGATAVRGALHKIANEVISAADK